jgi:hypothetical protein
MQAKLGWEGLLGTTPLQPASYNDDLGRKVARKRAQEVLRKMQAERAAKENLKRDIAERLDVRVCERSEKLIYVASGAGAARWARAHAVSASHTPRSKEAQSIFSRAKPETKPKPKSDS